MARKRLPTHIQALDAALGGGLGLGHTYVLTGLPGTGKSSLAYTMLHNMARKDSIGSLFVSFTMGEARIKQMATAMKLSHEEVAKKLLVVDRAQLGGLIESYGVGQTSLPNILKVKVQNLRDSAGCGLLVIDSITTMKAILDVKNPVAEFSKLLDIIEKLSLTAFIINEATTASPYSPDREELFVDGILETLVLPGCDGGPERFCAMVRKVTGTTFARDPMVLDLYPADEAQETVLVAGDQGRQCLPPPPGRYTPPGDDADQGADASGNGGDDDRKSRVRFR
jgi:KaiC/GvpD/RAD55 family RecA-like ATPase